MKNFAYLAGLLCLSCCPTAVVSPTTFHKKRSREFTGLQQTASGECHELPIDFPGARLCA